MPRRGKESKRSVLKIKTVIQTVIFPNELSFAQNAINYYFNPDDEDITDDFTDENEVWSEIVDIIGEDEDLRDINFHEEVMDNILDKVNLRWRATNKNSNVRGSSRTTYYRKDKARCKLHQDALSKILSITSS